MMEICKGDYVKTKTNKAHGIVTSKCRGLITVYIPPGSCGFGEYAGWSGIEFFLPSQLIVKGDFSGRPKGEILAIVEA